jgi:tripartite ATP-independent transporter DctM subunit
MPEWALSLLTGMALIFGLGAVGVPIAFSLLLSGFICISTFLAPTAALVAMKVVLYGAVTEAALLPIPLFVLMASVFVASGVSARAYDSFARLFGGFRAGLLVATNGMLAFLGSLMGSSSAAITMVTQMGAPELKARGYSNIAIGGVIAGGAGLAVVIPPSILMILYSVVMEVPVIPLFAAGLVPGLLMALGNTIWIIIYTRMYPPRQVDARPAPASENASSDASSFSAETVAAMRGQITVLGRLRAAAELIPLVAVAVVMLGSMFLGIASVTEGAAVGVLGALLVGLRHLTLRKLWWALSNTAQITCFIMMLIVGGRYFGMYFSLTGISQEFIAWIEALPLSGMQLLMTIMAIFLLLGCVMETISMMLVLVPIAAAALTTAGFDPIVLGVLFVINMEMSLTTPPIGGNLFVLAGMGRPYGITFEQVVRGAIPYLFIAAGVIVLVAFFPILATFLPSLLE